jgi:hypothetical protein
MANTPKEQVPIPVPTDKDTFDFGKQFNGENFGNVPASYFMWMLENTQLKQFMRIGKYIEANWDAIKQEAKADNKNKNR